MTLTDSHELSDTAIVIRIEKKKGNLVILPSRCKGCSLCVDVCPKQVLALEGRSTATAFRTVTAVHPDKCILCRKCEYSCPDFAIYATKDKKKIREEDKIKL